MDKQAVLQEFNNYLEKYPLTDNNYPAKGIGPVYEKSDLLNFYIQGRLDANNETLKLIKS